MKIGIDLLWVRPGKNGGTESYIRNLLDGLSTYGNENDRYYLYLSRDNAVSFEEYFIQKNFVRKVMDVDNAKQAKRVIWENLHLSAQGVRDELDVWFMPVYSRPFLMSKKISCITVIHDLQALHYPEYFSKGRNLFFRLSWWIDCHTSAKIVTISEFCKKDIVDHYKISPEKVEVIYNPIIIDEKKTDFTILTEKYGIEKKQYYYTVSSLAKHKNLITLLKMIRLMKTEGENPKLVITGVKVNAANEIMQYIKENDLGNNVVYTGFISNEDRNALYDNCKVFLFPSVFEGFGMPPVEAMMRGVPVITTRMTSLYEVTQGKAIYVDNPFNETEWKEKAEASLNNHVEVIMKKYMSSYVTEAYMNLFENRQNRYGGKHEG